MLHSVRTKLKKRYYRNKGKHYKNSFKFLSKKHNCSIHTMKIFCKSNDFKSINKSINSFKTFNNFNRNKHYKKFGLDS